jgi:hypothetical protein
MCKAICRTRVEPACAGIEPFGMNEYRRARHGLLRCAIVFVQDSRRRICIRKGNAESGARFECTSLFPSFGTVHPLYNIALILLMIKFAKARKNRMFQFQQFQNMENAGAKIRDLKIQCVLKQEEGLKGIKGLRWNKIKQEAEVKKIGLSDLLNQTIHFF